MQTSVTAEEAFRQLADGLGQSGSAAFFTSLVQRLAGLLRVDHVMVAEVDEDAQASTLAVWSQGTLRDNIRYPLAGTPCERAVGRDLCLFPENVGSLFPDDELLRTLGAESYLGLPLHDAHGEVMGLLAVLKNTPMRARGVEQEVLRIAAVQAGAELGRRRVEASLREREAQARESERRLDTLMHHLPGMAYRCLNDPDWTMLFVSRGAKALTGYPAEMLVGSRGPHYAALIHADDQARVFDEVQAAVARDEAFQVIYRLRHADGSLRWLWEQGQAVLDEAGGVRCLEGFITDITRQHESRRIQEAVVRVATTITTRLGEGYFDQLVANLVEILEADAGFISTLDGGPDDFRSLTTQSLVVDGEPVENITYPLAGARCARVLEERDCLAAAGEAIALPGDALKDVLPAQAWIGRRLDNARGEPIGVIMVLYRRPLEDTHFAESVLRILATGAAAELERRRDHQRMRQLAYVDAITGLPNRICFMERLTEWRGRAEREQRPLGLLLLDVRRFKEVNDTHGHQVGDQVLATLAERLRGVIRHHEFLARLSGDEFALLLPDVGEATLDAAIERLQAAIAEPLALDHREFQLQAGIGTARYPQDALDPGELFQHASIALFHAKQRDSGSCRFEPAMSHDLHHRQAMAERFLAALQGGGLSLDYQPQFDLASGELTGAEALCRWHDPEWGWVSPAEFIPLAEERGLIRALGDWVLQEACRQLLAWRRAGLDLPGRLSINVSAQQFDDPRLAERIADWADDGLAGAIALEITESDVMRDPEQAVATTRTLRGAGFALAIDDFGTGYSSLAYLRRFDLDALKIDISFVRDMLDSHHDRTIVETIIAMARALGLMTVAEGVECHRQAEALAAMGCDQAQGYHYGPPVDGVTFAERWGAAMGVAPVRPRRRDHR